MLRIAILWRELPPYTVSCIRALSMHKDVELLVVRYSHENEKPFDEKSRCLPIPIYTIYENDGKRNQLHELTDCLEKFRPNLLLVSGWSNSIFNKAVRLVKSFNCKVICVSDNVWRGNIKHTIGTLFARIIFKKRYSAMFVPGERAIPLAKALGYSGRNIIKGCYSCDWTLYSKAYENRLSKMRGNWPHVFVYIGSLIERKGIIDIVKAYQKYRENELEPWDLWIVGDGPLRDRIENTQGIKVFGFKQPEECAEILIDAGVFVLGSIKEAWGVVIHEAASAGLPILCTDVCGASADLVTDGFNGYTYERGDIGGLCVLMKEISKRSDTEISNIGYNSYNISKRYTPTLWSDSILKYYKKVNEIS